MKLKCMKMGTSQYYRLPQSKEKTEIQRNVKFCTTVYA